MEFIIATGGTLIGVLILAYIFYLQERKEKKS